MTRPHPTPSFAIYLTPQGIELRSTTHPPKQAQLICTCHNLQSARRITQTTARSQKLNYSEHLYSPSFNFPY